MQESDRESDIQRNILGGNKRVEYMVCGHRSSD